jgi:hypothetical protein
MVSAPQHNGYSSNVELNLEIRGRLLALHAIGPDLITLREGYEAPPGPATVIMRVDGREDRWSVLLPDGLLKGERTARVEQVAFHADVAKAV